MRPPKLSITKGRRCVDPSILIQNKSYFRGYDKVNGCPYKGNFVIIFCLNYRFPETDRQTRV